MKKIPQKSTIRSTDLLDFVKMVIVLIRRRRRRRRRRGELVEDLTAGDREGGFCIIFSCVVAVGGVGGVVGGVIESIDNIPKRSINISLHQILLFLQFEQKFQNRTSISFFFLSLSLSLPPQSKELQSPQQPSTPSAHRPPSAAAKPLDIHSGRCGQEFLTEKYSANNATLCPVSLVLRKARAAFHDGGGVDAVGVFEVLYIWERDFLGRDVLRLLFVFLLPMRRGGKEVCGFSSRFINPTRRISFKPLWGFLSRK